MEKYEDWDSFFEKNTFDEKLISDFETKLPKNEINHYGLYSFDWKQGLSLVKCNICCKKILPQAFYWHLECDHPNIVNLNTPNNENFDFPPLIYFKPSIKLVLKRIDESPINTFVEKTFKTTSFQISSTANHTKPLKNLFDESLSKTHEPQISDSVLRNPYDEWFKYHFNRLNKRRLKLERKIHKLQCLIAKDEQILMSIPDFAPTQILNDETQIQSTSVYSTNPTTSQQMINQYSAPIYTLTLDKECKNHKRRKKDSETNDFENNLHGNILLPDLDPYNNNPNVLGKNVSVQSTKGVPNSLLLTLSNNANLCIKDDFYSSIYGDIKDRTPIDIANKCVITKELMSSHNRDTLHSFTLNTYADNLPKSSIIEITPNHCPKLQDTKEHLLCSTALKLETHKVFFPHFPERNGNHAELNSPPSPKNNFSQKIGDKPINHTETILRSLSALDNAVGHQSSRELNDAAFTDDYFARGITKDPITLPYILQQSNNNYINRFDFVNNTFSDKINNHKDHNFFSNAPTSTKTTTGHFNTNNKSIIPNNMQKLESSSLRQHNEVSIPPTISFKNVVTGNDLSHKRKNVIKLNTSTSLINPNLKKDNKNKIHILPNGMH